MIQRFIEFIGAQTLKWCDNLGDLGCYLYEDFVALCTTRLKIKKILYHMNYIGVGSLGIVALVGITVGAVIALQSYIGLQRFGADHFIGPIIFLSMAREFGPVFTAIMVIGRAGSAITAELGTMRITEQIDALQTLCINTHQYLIIPRIIASTLILPFLSAFCTFFGIISGYFMSVYMLNVNAEAYMEQIIANVELSDIINGLIKAFVFGFLLAVISTYKGYYATGGARGVGVAITKSVVSAILTIVVADYVLTSLMFTK